MKKERYEQHGLVRTVLEQLVQDAMLEGPIGGDPARMVCQSPFDPSLEARHRNGRVAPFHLLGRMERLAGSLAVTAQSTQVGLGRRTPVAMWWCLQSGCS